MLIAGNWKMFKGPHEARVFASTIRGLAELAHGVDVVVCPHAVSLTAAEPRNASLPPSGSCC